jgi:hypothetical protein
MIWHFEINLACNIDTIVQTCKAGMLFAERRYVDELPRNNAVSRYLGWPAPKHLEKIKTVVESKISGHQHLIIHIAFREMT